LPNVVTILILGFFTASQRRGERRELNVIWLTAWIKLEIRKSTADLLKGPVVIPKKVVLRASAPPR
jgi:hypothetical protein